MAAYKEVRVLSAPEAAYLAGLIDGEGTVTLSRKHADDMRQLIVSISNTELPILQFALASVGAGKLLRAERRLFEDAVLGLLSGDRKKEPLQPSS
ncbi:MAG TPA: LAGLIDADG family homing endonuclease [Steroidobacteraceae bacterium]|nr:LAGLIDADG family homing endonuclease [Steroidobacteraceae bacterium]